MKRAITMLISVILFVSMLVLGVVSKMQAQDTQGQQCSLSTLQGAYGFSFSGFQQLVQTTPPVFATTASFPSVSVGTVTFNGAGLFSAVATSSNNGTISPTMTASGAYTVNPDCTGSTTLMSGGFTSTANIVIVHAGSEILFIITNTGAVQSGIAIKQ